MFPPYGGSQGIKLDVDAISQIFGSISIACWIGTCIRYLMLVSATVAQHDGVHS